MDESGALADFRARLHAWLDEPDKPPYPKPIG